MVSGTGDASDGPDECWFVGRGPVAADRYDLQSQPRRNTQDQQTKNVVEYNIWCGRGNSGVCAWIYACGQTYSLKTWSFSAASIPYFESVPFLSLGSVIFCSYLLRVLYLILVGCVTKMVQSKVKSRSLTIYVSLLLGLIPVLLL